jgi:hypothetical protein
LSLPKIAIIGFGKRVQGTIIPALVYQKDKFQLCSVYTRKKITTPDLITSQRNIDFDNFELKDFQPTNYDYVYLGIPPSQLFIVLQNIVKNHKYLKHVNLILDTPFPIGKNPLTILKIAKLLRNFKSHIILEDCLYLEPYAHASLVSQGLKLGEPRFAHFIHSGFRYHAYSQVKKIHNLKYFHFVVRLKTKSPHRQQLIFNKFRHLASITEPRNYTYGKFSFWYKHGVYSDFVQNENPDNLLNLVVSPRLINKQLVGFNVKCNEDNVYEIKIHDAIKMEDNDIGNSVFNISKIHAVVCFFDELTSRQTNMYQTIDCVYDSIVDIFVNRIGIFFDIPIPFKRSTVLYMILQRLFK